MPPHLQLTLLNVPPALDATAALPRPQHVVLNHLYCQRAPSTVNALVVGTTTRSISCQASYGCSRNNLIPLFPSPPPPLPNPSL